MGKAKRVRFLDDETDDFLPSGPNSCSARNEAAQPRVFDAPKTSEYAFFKKLKKNAGCSNFHEHPKVNNGSRITTSCNHQLAGSSNPSDIRRELDTRFLFHPEGERPAKQYSYISPPRFEPKSTTKWHTDSLNTTKRSLSGLSGNISHVGKDVFFSPKASASVNSENQYYGKGLFSGKRQKLHQQAVDTLSPQFGEICSKRFDFVSKLLRRLLPMGSENDDSKLAKQSMDTIDQLPDLAVSDELEKRIYLFPKKRSRELEIESFLSDVTPTYHPEYVKKIHDPELYHSFALHDGAAKCQNDEAMYVSDPKVIRSLCQKSDALFCSPYRSRGTRPLHIQELNGYSDPFKAAKEEPQNFLLDGDFYRDKEEPDFYTPSDAVKHLYSTLGTYGGIYKQQNVGDRLDEIALSSVSIHPQSSSMYNLLPYCQPTGFDIQKARRLEYDDFMHLEPGKFLSRLSFTPRYHIQEEDYDTGNVLGDGNIFCHQDHPLCISNVLGEKQQLAFESLQFRRVVDSELRWKCLSLTPSLGESQPGSYYASRLPQIGELPTSCLIEEEHESCLHNPRETYVTFSESSVTHQDYSITETFNRTIGHPLLIEYSSWDGS